MNTIFDAFQIGVQHLQSGRCDAAEQAFRHVLRAEPNHADALHLLGSVLSQTGRVSEAVTCYHQALRVKPDDPYIHNNLANALRAEMPDAAIASYHQALRCKPDFPEARFNLGVTLQEQGKIDESVANYEEALRLKPEFAEAHYQLGIVHQRHDRLDEAMAHFCEAVQIKPNDAEFHGRIATVLQSRGQLDDAIHSYRTSLRLNPNNAIVCDNLACALKEKGNLDEAIAAHQHALRIKPDYVRGHFNLGLTRLLAGQLAAGWPEYEWRIKDIPLPVLPLSRWDGSPLAGRRILLLTEQGLGDTLQFIRYAPLVKARGGHVIVGCQPALIPFLTGFEGIDELIPRPTILEQMHIPFDVYLHLMSLPGVLGTTLESIPNHVPYFHADEQLIEHWKHELAGGDGIKIGIAWRGNRKSLSERGRSIPLAEFEPLCRVEGVRLFSLQKGDGSEQVRELAGRLQITDYADRMDSTSGPFRDTAALMRSLDLVITADTSIAHLAGALGVPVWVALRFCPDWRWMMGRDDTPWYPTMRLFRQEKPGDWTGVFQRMSSEIIPARLVHARRTTG